MLLHCAGFISAGRSSHHLIWWCDDLPATITHVPVFAVPVFKYSWWWAPDARNMQSESAEIKPAQCSITLVFYLTSMHLLPPHPSQAFTLPHPYFPTNCLATPFTRKKIAVISFAGDTPFELVDIGHMPAGGENSGYPRTFSSPQSMWLLPVASVSIACCHNADHINTDKATGTWKE